MMHILLVSRSGIGKSGLIRRVTQALNRPVFGYESVKEDALADPVNGSPIYLYEIGKPRLRSAENLAGYCLNRHATTFPGAFDRFAPRLRAGVPEGYIIVLDEIGPMESGSPAFRDAILALLDGDVPVIAAVRDKNTPFLNTVRSHPNCKCFYLTPENRDSVFSEIIKEEVFR